MKKFQKTPPYTHSLLRLCKELSLELSDEKLEAMTVIDRYYLATRYPAYKEGLNIADKTKAGNFFEKAQELLQWLKTMLNI